MRSLHNHSMFSLHDSAVKPYDLVKKAADLGITDITLTDHGSLLGIEEFMEAGEKFGVNTIPGVEAYIPEHLIIFAKNYSGYRSIFHAVKESTANLTSTKVTEHPIMTEEILKKHFEGNENVVITTACVGGPIAKILLYNTMLDKEKDKLIKKLEPYNGVKEHNQIQKETLENYKNAISALKEESKVFVGFTKKPFQKRIDQLKGKISNAETVKEMEAQRDHAAEVIRNNKEMLEKLTAMYKQIKTDLQKSLKAEKLARNYENEIKKLPYKKENEIISQAKATVNKYAKMFPNFYIELQYHHMEEEAYVMPILASIAKECHVPVIAANDAHMLDNTPDSIKARQILRFNYFKTHTEISDADRELYIKTDDELCNTLNEILDENTVKEAIKNLDILKSCRIIYPNQKHYPISKSEENFDEVLKKERLRRIEAGKWGEEYEKRLQYESKIIKQMNFVEYHMVERSICQLAKKLGTIPKDKLNEAPIDINELYHWIDANGFCNGLGLGPGRGSAVGSLVCNMLGITNVDPIKYNLFFERFLNPERVTMPDIDSDIATSIRPHLIRCLRQIYGKNAICSIASQGTYGPKKAISLATRDRIRELYPKPRVRDYNTREEYKVAIKTNQDKIQAYRKHIIKLSSSLPDDTTHLIDYKEMISEKFPNDTEIQLIYHNATLIEGILSNISVHAGGIVISDNDNINDYVPLAWNNELGIWVAQCDMGQIEKRGLLKIDLLGLKTLDIISDCAALVYKNYGIHLDLYNLPIETSVFKEIYAKGRTIAVFQTESQGMQHLLMRFWENIHEEEDTEKLFEDFILLIACYRPGPMQYLDDIIEVKHGNRELSFKTPELEPILKNTYGAVIYQEQVMLIFQKLAGYSLGGADLVRRAMAKKNTEKLELERKAFLYGDESRNIIGCQKNGIDVNTANELFDELMNFAKYAFNKSHSTVYAQLSYTMAYLKYHYPKEFICAVLNHTEQKEYQPLFEDCIYYGIKILPPTINQSGIDFTTEDDSIRYGFRGIKGISEKNEVIHEIEQNRSGYTKIMPYTSFQNFIVRNIIETPGENILNIPTIGVMEPLILTGCFDQFNKNREALLMLYKDIIKKTNMPIMDFITNVMHTTLPDNLQNKNAIREHELTYLGMILSYQPLEGYAEESYYGCNKITDVECNKKGNLLGYIADITRNKTKTYKDMTILSLSTKERSLQVLFFEEAARKIPDNYAGEVVKISVEYNNGAYYGKNLQIQPQHIHQYLLDISSMDEFFYSSKILKDEWTPSDTGYNVLYIRSIFHQGNRLQYPKLYSPIYVADQIISKLPVIELI